MKLQIKKTEDGEHYIDIDDLKGIIDTSQVEYYKLEFVGDNLVLQFFDKDKNIISPREIE